MKKDYKKAYDDLTISDRLHDKLMDIPKEKKSAWGVIFKTAVTAMAMFLMLFSTDMISFAVTGEGVAERVQKTISETKKVSVKSVEINGKQIEDFKINENGDVLQIEDPIYGKMGIRITEDMEENIVLDELPAFSVHSDGDKVFAVVGLDYLRIDITEDMIKGNSVGEFEADGRRFSFYVYIAPEAERYASNDEGYRWRFYEMKDK